MANMTADVTRPVKGHTKVRKYGEALHVVELEEIGLRQRPSRSFCVLCYLS